MSDFEVFAACALVVIGLLALAGAILGRDAGLSP